VNSIRELPGHLSDHYSSIGNILDTVLITLFIIVICLWAVVVSKTNDFSKLVKGHFDVYDDLDSPGNFFDANESGMSEMLQVDQVCCKLEVAIIQTFETTAAFMFCHANLYFLRVPLVFFSSRYCVSPNADFYASQRSRFNTFQTSNSVIYLF
jgi:hypothetical protein